MGVLTSGFSPLEKGDLGPEEVRVPDFWLLLEDFFGPCSTTMNKVPGTTCEEYGLMIRILKIDKTVFSIRKILKLVSFTSCKITVLPNKKEAN